MKDDLARDRAIEKLVAERLRSKGRAAFGKCPEAEVLAAFVERTLAPRERLTCESHLASCVGCQEQVAALVRLSDAEMPTEVRVAAAPSRLSWLAGLRWAWAAPLLVALVVGGLWYTGEYRRYTQVPEEKAKETLAPATESVPTQQKQGMETRNIRALPPREAAKKQLQGKGIGTLALSAQPKTPKPTEPPPLGERSVRGESAPAPAAPSGPERLSIATPSERLRLVAPAAHSNLPADSFELRKDERPAPPPAAKPGNQAAEEKVGIAAAGPPLKQASTSEPGASGGSVTHEGEYSSKETATPQRSLRAAGPSAAAGLTSHSFGRSIGGGVAVTIAGKWRVGARGLIQKSEPGGGWITRPTGVDSDLFAITFPTPTVGWAVGQAGAILRSTDGGSTWTRIAPPTSEDLVEVTGQGELTARIETRRGRVLVTDDGGRTWTQERR